MSCNLSFFIFSENLILANTAKFDLALPLPGSLWNNYFLWSKSLETNFPDDECGGFCYFHDPDPSECTFAVADVSDPTNRICYMGSFLSESGGLETGTVFPHIVSVETKLFCIWKL